MPFSKEPIILPDVPASKDRPIPVRKPAPTLVGLTIDLTAYPADEGLLQHLLWDILEFQIDAADSDVFYPDAAPDGFHEPRVSPSDCRLTFGIQTYRATELERLVECVTRFVKSSYDQATVLRRDLN